MEGVGARVGRSSSRYGTTTVFTGPVRKWTKHWVPISPSSSTPHHHHSNHHSNHLNNSNASLNGSNSSSVSHLRLYKWTPLSKHTSSTTTTTVSDGFSSPHDKNKKINSSDSPTKDDDDTVSVEPPRRKFKFIPIAVLEGQKKENELNSDDEVKPIEADEDIELGNNKKPDINDVPMEWNRNSEVNQMAPARQDLNELDLSLGLTSHEEEHISMKMVDHKAKWLPVPRHYC